jgi:hypothetical protein
MVGEGDCFGTSGHEVSGDAKDGAKDRDSGKVMLLLAAVEVVFYPRAGSPRRRHSQPLLPSPPPPQNSCVCLFGRAWCLSSRCSFPFHFFSKIVKNLFPDLVCDV